MKILYKFYRYRSKNFYVQIGRNEDCFLQTNLTIFLLKLIICFVMNFIPVVPAGKCEANNHANAINYYIF